MDGIIIVNKEKGWTSNDVVQKAKKIFNEKVGHTGTLDPMATGVLPLLIGKGTLLSKYLINHDKIYIATIKLGVKTITGDSEGEIIEKNNVPEESLKENVVKQILNSFKGTQKQIPPMYSAIKVKGKKLYEYARNGQTVEIPQRKITIYDIELLKINKNLKEITYKVSCSKGTYIRTLCEDIAKKLKTVGYMKELNRIKVGDFVIEDASTISDIQGKFTDIKWLNDNFITLEKFFRNYDAIILDEKKMKMFLNGVNLESEKESGVYKIYNHKNIFIGTGIVNKEKLKRDIII